MFVCELLQTPKQTERSKKACEYWRQCEKNKKRQSRDSPNSGTLGASCEITKGEHDNSWCDKWLVSTVATPSTLPLSDRCPFSVVAGHAEDGVALQTQGGSYHVGTVWLQFRRSTDQVLPSVSLNHALQKSCSTDI